MQLARRHKSLDKDDDMSSKSEPDAKPSGSARTRRSQARLRHHLEVLLSSMDVTFLKNAMSLLEQISVKTPARNSYREIMADFLKFCDNQTPLANVDDPATEDVTLVAFGNHLYAGGRHKSVLQKAVASFLFHLPELRKAGSYGLPRSYRALRAFA